MEWKTREVVTFVEIWHANLLDYLKKLLYCDTICNSLKFLWRRLFVITFYISRFVIGSSSHQCARARTLFAACIPTTRHLRFSRSCTLMKISERFESVIWQVFGYTLHKEACQKHKFIKVFQHCLKNPNTTVLGFAAMKLGHPNHSRQESLGQKKFLQNFDLIKH